MSEQPERRFEVVVEEGVPRGGLYEMEQTTYFHVVDRHTGQAVLTFESRLEASFSTDSGQWDDYRMSGIISVTVAADERSVVVVHGDGHTETVPFENCLDHIPAQE